MSIPGAGVIYPSDLQAIKSKAEQIFSDQLRNAQYIPDVAVAQTILARQTANMQVIQRADKENTLTVVWNELCSDVALDCDTDDCTLTGVQGSTQSQDYELGCIAKAGFSINLTALRTNMYSPEEFQARAWLAIGKSLDEQVAQLVMAGIIANPGENQLTSPYTVAGTTTTIPPSAWTPALFGYIREAIVMNRLNGAFVLSGRQLYQQDWMVRMNAANANGKGALNMIDGMDVQFDLFNLATAGVGNNVYIIHPGALGLVTKSKFTDTPTLRYFDQPQWQYRMKSPSLPGVYWDIRRAETCVNGVETITYQGTVTGAVVANPTGCNEDITGILELVCG
jgi:hypothetical protein